MLIENHTFTGCKESVRKKIVMAAPPRGAKVIFEAVSQSFAGIDYHAVPCNINIE